MNTRHAFRCLCVASAILMTALFYARAANPQSPVATSSIQTSGGLTVATFNVNAGRIKVYLPDDMRAGDTVSGTASADPNGKTKEEQTVNQAELKDFGIRLSSNAGDKPVDVSLGDVSTAFKYYFLKDRPSGNVISVGLYLVAAPTSTIRLIEIPLTPSGAVVTPDPKITPPFYFPLTGQTGRPITITGPFDGDSANTSVKFRADRNINWDKVTDFEKGARNVSGGFGLIAESPRKAVFEAPPNLVGAVELKLTEGPTEKTSEFRNVGVQLSAPKTNLTRGEKTVVTIEVSGLAGIIKDVPLQLDSKGVITMEGGSFQNLRIKPEEVGVDGRYKTNRTITGLQAGGFNVTATVVVGPFDFALQDDNDPNRLFHFNSFTGNYVFACGGGSCRSGAGETSSQPPTASPVTPPPVTLTGIGKPQMKGCIITLSHNAPDRRVFARLDACTKTGDASVETSAPKTNFNITDKNTADNTVSSPPPK